MTPPSKLFNLGLLALTGIAFGAGDTVKPDSMTVITQAQVFIAEAKWPEAETQLLKILRQTPPSPWAENAALLLIDAYVRQGKSGPAEAALQKFRRQFPNSSQFPRLNYYQGVLALGKGRNDEAARSLAAAVTQSDTRELYAAASQALRHLVQNDGLTVEGLEAVLHPLGADPELGPWLLETLGGAREKLGRFLASEAAYVEYLGRYPDADGIHRVRSKLEKVRESAKRTRNVLIMAPFSGEFAEVGRSLREGVLLAFEDSKRNGMTPPEVRMLDDQGNVMHGIRQFRKLLREERIDAVVGPAMSDVATGAAIELSARQSKIPLITPTATTDGIASLGEGVFQLNVTTYALGRRIAEYAVDCLDLQNFAILAPHSEYGFQLAETFAKTVESKGGSVAAVAYVDPEAKDLSEPLQEMRRKLSKLYFDKMKSDGLPLPNPKEMKYFMADTAFPVDGIFIPAVSGDEANRLASQFIFNKMKGRMLGSSGWYDKSLLMKNSEAAQGAYFSVDFQDQPKTESYAAFSRAYQERWQRTPDRVAALSFDAARFLLAGLMASNDGIIPALRSIKTFPGVLGDIVFGGEGANQNTALFKLDKKNFKEMHNCAVDSVRTVKKP